MDLKQLQTFLTLSELKSFTRTADKLGYAQSNITAQIKQLETELGVRLFNRLGHTITLTEKGKELVPYAAQILSLSREATVKIAPEAPATLTIAASESLCTYRLPHILNIFQQNDPEIEIHIQVLDTTDFLTLLTNNTADLVYILETPIVNPYLCCFSSRKEPIHVYAAPDSPFSKIRNFSDVPLLLTGEGCCYRRAFLKNLKESGIVPRIVLETGSLQIIKEMTLYGIGVCVLPEMAVSREVEQGLLVKLPSPVNCNIFSQLLYHKDKYISPAMQAFLDIASAHQDNSLHPDIFQSRH